MNSKKIIKVFVCVLSAIMSVSGATAVSAHSFAEGLKKCLLNAQNEQINIYSYNTNNDNSVNVFDFCRLKRNILNVPEETTVVTTSTPDVTVVPPVTTVYNKTGNVKFDFQDAQIINDGKKIKIPILIRDNSIGIISLQMKINFDHQYFRLESVENGELGGNWSVSGVNSVLQFNSDNGIDITASWGVLGYIVFDAEAYTPSSTYVFSASGLQASTSLGDNNFRTLTLDECSDTIYDRYIYYNNTQVIVTPAPSSVTVTEPPVSVTTQAAAPAVTTQQAQINAEKTDIELQAAKLINEWRKEIGLSPFEDEDALYYCADIRANELVQSYSSKRPDGSKVMDLLRQNKAQGWFGYMEFYTKGVTDASKMVIQYRDLVKKNPGVLVDNPNYTHIGIGYYNGYWDVILTR